MDQVVKIADIGIMPALQLLLDRSIRRAGLLARALQPSLGQAPQPSQKGGSRFVNALTDVDILIQDQVGADILTLFRDASFFGEEYESDRISRYIPKDRPYIITLDPINSTLYYRYQLPIYEIIVTICRPDWTLCGALLYRPAFTQAFIASCVHDMPRALRIEEALRSEVFAFSPHTSRSRNVYLDAVYAPKAELVRAAGFEPIFPWRDFKGETDWDYASCDILLGRCRGVLNPGAQLIDAAATGFIAACAGGVWEAGPFDPLTKKYTYGLSASDEQAAAVLRQLL